MKSETRPTALPRRTTQDLTPAERGLVEIMRRQQFGRIENLRVEAGQPILRSDTRGVRMVRISGAVEQSEFPVQDDE